MKNSSSHEETPFKTRLEWIAAYCDTLWAGLHGYVYGAVGIDGYWTNPHGQGSYKFDRWVRYPFTWPDEAETLVEGALHQSAENDVYVCPMLRTTDDPDHIAKLDAGMGGRHAWVDLDKTWTAERDRRLTSLLTDQSLVVLSGSGRHAYIALDDVYNPGQIESLNRGLAKHLSGDSKWRNNSVLRLPGTYNHKERAKGGESALVRLTQP